jgi:hypothetical protein
MLSIPPLNENISVIPASKVPRDILTTIPYALRKYKVFALTAFDPPGVTRSLQENTKANVRLYEDLRELRPRPDKVWRSFGMHAGEGWREDGYCVAFFAEDNAISTSLKREAVVKLARQFDQGAIFEYEYLEGNTSSTDANLLLRHTVPVVAGREVEGSEEVACLVETSPVTPGANTASELMTRPWAGPATFSW